MLRELDFTRHSVGDLNSGFREMFREDFRERNRRLLKEFLQDLPAPQLQRDRKVNQYRRGKRW